MVTVNAESEEIRSLLSDEGTQGLVLLSICLHLFGDAVFGGDDTPQLDTAELWDDIHTKTGVWIPEECENKITALIMALENDLFYTDPVVFTSIANALYDGDLGDLVNGVFENPSLIEMMWAITEVELARNDEEGPPVFAKTIEALINSVAEKEMLHNDAAEQAIAEEIADMFLRMRKLGVTPNELRLLSEEHTETMEYIDNIADSQNTLVSAQ